MAWKRNWAKKNIWFLSNIYIKKLLLLAFGEPRYVKKQMSIVPCVIWEL
jgi:hypothetical protein